jgi:uncharacterized membrane protein
LGNTTTQNGLLAINLENPQGALLSKISVLDALLVSAEIANTQSAIDLGQSLNLGTLGSISTKALIIQPPVIAVGEAGLDANGTPRTSAYAAQVRFWLGINLLNNVLNVPGVAILGGVNLQLYVDAGDGKANLQSTQCAASRQDSRSTIQVQPGIAGLCLGGDAVANLLNSTTPFTCKLPAQVLSVNLLNIVTANVTSDSINLNLQSPNPTPLKFDALPGNSDDYQSTSTPPGGATAGLLTQLVAQLPGAVHLVAGSPQNPVDLTSILLVKDVIKPVLAAVVTNILGPALNQLDSVLVPLLQALGVQIGAATVHDTSLTCGEAQLVN